MELIFYLLSFRSYNDKTINNTFTAQQTTVSAVRNTADGTAALETAAAAPTIRRDYAFPSRCRHSRRLPPHAALRRMPNSVTARRIPYSGAYTRSPET